MPPEWECSRCHTICSYRDLQCPDCLRIGHLILPPWARRREANTSMREEYDFSHGKRGAVLPDQGKTQRLNVRWYQYILALDT